MSNVIGSAFGLLNNNIPIPLNSTPQGALAQSLFNIGEQVINQVASQITNALFSGLSNATQNFNPNSYGGGYGSQGGGGYGNYGGQGGGSYGVQGNGGYGGQGNGGGDFLNNLLQQTLQQLGINPQNNLFNAGLGQDIVNAFTQGVANGLNNYNSQQSFPLNPSNSNDYGLVGNAIGSQVGSQVGLDALNDVTTKSLKGVGAGVESLGGSVTGGSKETRSEIGKFMDQHPEVFGSPKSPPGEQNPKSWEDALKNGKALSNESLQQFQNAKNDLKTSLLGGSITPPPGSDPGTSTLLNADAQLYNNNITNDSFKHNKLWTTA